MQILSLSIPVDNVLQRLGFYIGISYLSIFILSLFFYSPTRVSQSTSAITEALTEIKSNNKPAGAIFRDFDRTEYVNSKAKWNIKASRAEYSTESGVINLTAPDVIVFDKGNEKPTLIKAKTSRLTVVEGVVQSAFLEGDVEIISGGGAVIRTTVSEYVERESRLTCPDHVYIDGPGYEIQGDSSDVNTLTDEILIRGNIESKFESSAKMPLSIKSVKK